MNSWDDIIANRLDKIDHKRECRAKIIGDSRHLVLSNTSYLNWTSFNYLSLSNHPVVVDALVKASLNYGISSTAAPTLCGYSNEHEKLAIELAAWLGYEKCLLFTSGYQIAVGLFSQLADTNTTIWLDKNCHASHIDGILLSKAKFVTFTPETLNHVILQIKSQPTRLHIILTEATFSMDGTCSYLPQLIALKNDCREHILLIIDDAHGLGALGGNGLGTLEQLNLEHANIDLLIGTLGKSFASHGGFIAGSSLIINYLQQTVRSFLYSTCLPAGIAAASRASLDIIKSAEGIKLRQRLAQNIVHFNELSRFYNLPVYRQDLNMSAIQLLVFDDEAIVKKIANQLLEQGILCGCIVYPTVAKSLPRIRISINAGHLVEDIEQLCYSLSKAVLKYV